MINFLKNTNSKNKIQLIPLLLLVIIVIYGSLARWSVIDKTIINAPIRADASDYFYYAKNLSESLIYSRDKKNTGDDLKKDALRSPGFPFFASLFYQGENINSVTALIKAQTIRVLRGAFDRGPIRRQSPCPVGGDQLLRQQRPHVVKGDLFSENIGVHLDVL